MSDSAIHPVLQQAIERAPRGAWLRLYVCVLGSRALRRYTARRIPAQDFAYRDLMRLVGWAGSVDRAAALLVVPGPTLAGWHERRYQMDAAARSLVCLVARILALDRMSGKRRRHRIEVPTSGEVLLEPFQNLTEHEHALRDLQQLVKWGGSVDRAATLLGVPGPTAVGWRNGRYRMDAAARSLVCLTAKILRLDKDATKTTGGGESWCREHKRRLPHSTRTPALSNGLPTDLGEVNVAEPKGGHGERVTGQGLPIGERCAAAGLKEKF